MPSTLRYSGFKAAAAMFFVALPAASASTASPSEPDSTSVAAPTPSPAAATTAPESPRWQKLDQREGQGERCLVCGMNIHGEDVVEIRYRGRTFHVAAKLLEQFADNPDTYFMQLQARSALFDERAHGTEMSYLWLVIGTWILLSLNTAALSAYVAMQKGRRGWPWFVAGLLGNVFAVVAAFLLKPQGLERYPQGMPRGLTKVPTTRAPVSCPQCGHSNHPAARACAACGTSLTPTVEPESVRA